METSLVIKRQLPPKPQKQWKEETELEYEIVDISLEGVGDIVTDIINKLTEFCKEKGWLLK